MTDPVNAAIVEHFHTTWKVIPFPRNTCASCSKAYTSVLGCHSGSFSFPMQYRSGTRPLSAGPRNGGRLPLCLGSLPSALTQ